jgi:hypothetical protein
MMVAVAERGKAAEELGSRGKCTVLPLALMLAFKARSASMGPMRPTRAALAKGVEPFCGRG